jgi:hypothetical protein
MRITLLDTWNRSSYIVRDGIFPNTLTDFSPFVMYALDWANKHHVPQMRLNIEGHGSVILNYGTLTYCYPQKPTDALTLRTLGGY